MDVRLFLRLAVVSMLVTGSACNDESLPQRPTHSNKGDSDDDDDDDSTSTKRDAGKDAGKGASKDAGKDAGAKRDAGKNDAAVDEEPGDDLPADAGPKRDAGGPTVAATRDAGQATTPPQDTGTQRPPDTTQQPPDTTQQPPDTVASTDPCDGVTYQASGAAAVLNTYCGTCHGQAATAGVSLNSLDGARTNSAKAAARVSAGTMPPKNSPQPSADESASLLRWVQCGAK